MISASDEQIKDLKSILKTATASERKTKSDLTHAIKDMNELKNEVKIQASMAAKAELHSQVYNQLVQPKDEIIGNQKEIINQMKINCQFHLSLVVVLFFQYDSCSIVMKFSSDLVLFDFPSSGIVFP